MTILVTVVHVFVCFLLISVILLQAGRGQGVGTSFGGGEGTQSIFGTRSADFLSKATTVAAILFLITSITLDIIGSRRARSLFETTTPIEAEELEALQEALAELQEGEQATETEATQTEQATAADATEAISATEPARDQAAEEVSAAVPETDEIQEAALADTDSAF